MPHMYKQVVCRRPRRPRLGTAGSVGSQRRQTTASTPSTGGRTGRPARKGAPFPSLPQTVPPYSRTAKPRRSRFQSNRCESVDITSPLRMEMVRRQRDVVARYRIPLHGGRRDVVSRCSAPSGHVATRAHQRGFFSRPRAVWFRWTALRRYLSSLVASTVTWCRMPSMLAATGAARHQRRRSPAQRCRRRRCSRPPLPGVDWDETSRCVLGAHGGAVK